ncbi:hypothetical protein CRG98_026732 [Punica granatum]|uniref:Reverse transcriptase Ty1/copia-type domain-containing protein n=1 Tax=Punica granatum TaxID=22663 RepID=A0A2I0J9G6_PUNGR|nr:hypothetical protein CRG98_026732 [Punica granatum]
MISSDQNKRRLCDNKDTEPRKSQSVRKEKDFGPDFISSQSLAYLVEGDRESVIRKIPIMLNVEGDPQTYGETMASRDAAFWKEAINDEMDSILFNNTWVLVDLPQGSQPIGCKWVFKRKNNPTGGSPTFKGRLVAKGFRTDLEGVRETKEYLTSNFKMKDLNDVDTILGIKVQKHERGFALNQSHYIEKVLEKFKHSIRSELQVK